MIRRTLLTVFFLLFLALSVSATDAEDALAAGIDPENGVPDEAVSTIGHYDGFSADSFATALGRLLSDAFGGLGGWLRTTAALCGAALAAILLCTLGDMQREGGAAGIVGALALTAIFAGGLTSAIRLGTDTVETVNRYSTLMLPGIASLSAAAGSPAASSALYLGTIFFLKLLMSLISGLLVPGIYVFTALSAAEAALDNTRLTGLREFVKWLLSAVLKLVLYVFTGYLTVTGILSGGADALRLKAARLALSGAVPVVGGIISDASDTLLTSAAAIRSAVGTYGLLAVLAVCFTPFLRVFAQYLLMKATTALSGLFGRKSHVTLMENLSGAMGLVAAMLAAYAIMLLLGITILIKAAI